MKGIAAFFSLLSLLIFQSFAFNSSSVRSSGVLAPSFPVGQGNSQTARDRRRADFEKARKLLIEKNVPFDPEILLTSDWRQTLRPVLDYYVPEFQETKRGSKRLKGVHLAHTLYLPEKVELEGDTVILVSNLIFEGQDAVIRGPFSIYVYPIDEAGVLGTSFEIASRARDVRFVKAGWSTGRGSPPLPIIRGGSITIDTHGLGRADWLKRQQAMASGRPKMIKAAFIQQGQNANGAYGGDGRWGVEGAQGTIGSPSVIPRFENIFSNICRFGKEFKHEIYFPGYNIHRVLSRPLNHCLCPIRIARSGAKSNRGEASRVGRAGKEISLAVGRRSGCLR